MSKYQGPGIYILRSGVKAYVRKSPQVGSTDLFCVLFASNPHTLIMLDGSGKCKHGDIGMDIKDAWYLERDLR